MFEIKMTKATEKRINALRKIDNQTNVQKLIVWVYDEMISRIGCYGASIKELEQWGIDFWADDQIKGHTAYIAEMNGLSSRFPEYIHYTDTLGLNCLTIKDFNKLVKAIV